jgi:hypothetical protein
MGEADHAKTRMVSVLDHVARWDFFLPVFGAVPLLPLDRTLNLLADND